MLTTLTTIFRAHAAEAEEDLAGRNAATLLAQHLRDAKGDIARSRAALARSMAHEAERARAVDALTDKIAARTTEAKAATAKAEPALAGDIADAILDLEDRREAEADALTALRERIDASRAALAGTERRYADLAEQLRAARDGAARRRPDGAAPASDALAKAAETAATLRTREQLRADLDAAHRRIADEAPEASLDARIARAELDEKRAARRAALMHRITSKGEGQ